jgi:peroxiredoxin family protein
MWITLISETREHLQMAGMITYIASVSEIDVQVFVSMNALAHFRANAPDSVPAEGMVGSLMDEKKAPAWKQLFSMAAELGGAKIHPCALTVDLMDIRRDELPPFMQAPMDLKTFLRAARHSRVLTF